MSNINWNFVSTKVILIILMEVLVVSGFIQSSEATPKTFELYPITSKVDGLSYSDLTAKWWEWITNIPEDKNPGLDMTGERCSIKQSGTVWFLAGTMGGSAERECQIEKGKSILFPIIGGYCSYLTDPTTTTVSDLRDCARKGNDDAVLQVSIDGISLENLDQARITTEPFPLVVLKDNVYGIPVGNTTAVADGYYVFIKPLAPGIHEIHFSGSIIDNPLTGVQGHAVDTKYKIIIK
jgi:hypothetical protein